MAITPNCDVCGKELDEYGAILFGPPSNNKSEKFHICKNCYTHLINLLRIKHK